MARRIVQIWQMVGIHLTNKWLLATYRCQLWLVQIRPTESQESDGSDLGEYLKGATRLRQEK